MKNLTTWREVIMKDVRVEVVDRGIRYADVSDVKVTIAGITFALDPCKYSKLVGDSDVGMSKRKAKAMAAKINKALGLKA